MADSIENAGKQQGNYSLKYNIATMGSFAASIGGAAGLAVKVINDACANNMGMAEQVIVPILVSGTLYAGYKLSSAFHAAANAERPGNVNLIQHIKKHASDDNKNIFTAAMIGLGVAIFSHQAQTDTRHQLAEEARVAKLPVLAPSTEIKATAAESYCNGYNGVKSVKTPDGKEWQLNCGG